MGCNIIVPAECMYSCNLCTQRLLYHLLPPSKRISHNFSHKGVWGLGPGSTPNCVKCLVLFQKAIFRDSFAPLYHALSVTKIETNRLASISCVIFSVGCPETPLAFQVCPVVGGMVSIPSLSRELMCEGVDTIRYLFARQGPNCSFFCRQCRQSG